MYNNLDIVFLGGLFPKETEAEIFRDSKGSIQNAANNLQWEIVKGLDANLDQPIKIFNSLYIGSFPKRYKKMVIDTYNFTHAPNCSTDINIGFLNFTGIKNLSRYFSLKPYLKSWAMSQSDNKKVIIAYAMTATFTHLLRYVKEINNNIVTCLIVPDLPQYMNLSNNKNKIYTALKNIEIKSIKSDMKYIDKYVLLTKYMHDALDIRVPSVVIEGVSTNLFENVDCIPMAKNIRTILYSGGLSEKYGVIDLIRSFEKLDEENYRLVICGSGEAEADILKASHRDKRIIFKGLLRREEVLQLQKSSNILVNPRPNNEEYTKYSFPSKMMEYLSSATPVVAYKLDGIPNEYYKYMYPIKSGTDGLFITLKEVLLKSEKELSEKGLLAKEFVLTQKSGKKQAEKILRMISNT